jgi:hypothetical protein
MEHGKFKEFMLEEWEFWDAIKHGFRQGVKAFNQKRTDQAKKTEAKTLTDKIISAEGKELESLIKQIVDNGYTIKQGQVQKPPKTQRASDWLLEYVRAQRRHQLQEDRSLRPASPA